MPWKGEKDPYRIWLSEIILQQTRVEQGTAYYKKFISRYPTVFELANAPEQDIFKCWEGLGYYTRCRNLILTAKKLAFDLSGVFPSAYSDILALPGVGPYTAAAIASFAFGLPHAVVDGNVERVLARYFGVSTPVGSATGKKFYTELAQSLLDKKNPANYNQAIMDFGATVCKPQNPLCTACIQATHCEAYQHAWTHLLPVKIQPAQRKTRWLYYYIISDGRGKVWIRERVIKDIWQHLYEFVLWETGQLIPQADLASSAFITEKMGQHDFQILHVSPVFSQTLTHQFIKGCFVHVKPNKLLGKLAGYQSVPVERLNEFPFPKMISLYIKNLPATDHLW